MWRLSSDGFRKKLRRKFVKELCVGFERRSNVKRIYELMSLNVEILSRNFFETAALARMKSRNDADAAVF